MTDTPPSDGPSQGAEFDMMGALDWKDGIATLPGSDIRVQKRFLLLLFFGPGSFLLVQIFVYRGRRLYL